MHTYAYYILLQIRKKNKHKFVILKYFVASVQLNNDVLYPTTIS